MKNKIAIVTGASKGIGAGIAKHFGSLGASVVVNYNSDDKGALKVVSEIEKAGGRAVAVKANMAKPEDVVRLFAETDKAFGPANVLVNNAGIYEWAPLEQTTLESLRRQIDTNVVGPYLAMQEALKRFKKGDSIINISSSVTRIHMPGSTSYGTTKAALDYLTRATANEVGHRGIRVNGISPGPVKTEGAAALATDPEFFEKVLQMVPLKRLGEPHDIAPLAAFLASDEASWITGENFFASGGA
jgi:3-oxoacyl-[acyl-carrier protein] reductase